MTDPPKPTRKDLESLAVELAENARRIREAPPDPYDDNLLTDIANITEEAAFYARLAAARLERE